MPANPPVAAGTDHHQSRVRRRIDQRLRRVTRDHALQHFDLGLVVSDHLVHGIAERLAHHFGEVGVRHAPGEAVVGRELPRGDRPHPGPPPASLVQGPAQSGLGRGRSVYADNDIGRTRVGDIPVFLKLHRLPPFIGPGAHELGGPEAQHQRVARKGTPGRAEVPEAATFRLDKRPR